MRNFDQGSFESTTMRWAFLVSLLVSISEALQTSFGAHPEDLRFRFVVNCPQRFLLEDENVE